MLTYVQLRENYFKDFSDFCKFVVEMSDQYLIQESITKEYVTLVCPESFGQGDVCLTQIVCYATLDKSFRVDLRLESSYFYIGGLPSRNVFYIYPIASSKVEFLEATQKVISSEISLFTSVHLSKEGQVKPLKRNLQVAK